MVRILEYESVLKTPGHLGSEVFVGVEVAITPYVWDYGDGIYVARNVYPGVGDWVQVGRITGAGV